MNLKNLARKIPNIVRSTRLMIDSDPIANATSAQGDPQFQMLFAIWFEFIEPNRKQEADISCPSCRQNILTNFREMKGVLIELEKEYKLLQRL